MRMTRLPTLALSFVAVLVTMIRPAAAQVVFTPPVPASLPPQMRGVPTSPASPAPITLTLADAVQRGLAHNLAIILEEQRTRTTASERLTALSEVLPHLSGYVRESREVLSTAAFGFTGFAGFPTLLGPFNVFDARLSVSTPILDARAFSGLRAGNALERAGAADAREVRETVVLAVGGLYLQAQAESARVDSVRHQVATADALVKLAQDQRAAGIVAGIDVVRQQVELESARARLISAENALAKRLLSLARAIGLPADQAITLASDPAFTPAPLITADEAVDHALADRDDLQAARARVEAARAVKDGELAGHLPSVHLDADVGVLGNHFDDTDKTYTVAATVRVPIFDGNNTRARVQRADAALKEREAELADLTAGIRYEIQSALLDVNAADAGVRVAESARALATQALEQAQDRFRAGVVTTIELVQAQDALGAATERYIASVYAHNIAKATLARAMGQAEARFLELVGGSK